MCWCVDWIRLLWGVIPSAAWGGDEAKPRRGRVCRVRTVGISVFLKTDLLNWSRRWASFGCDFLPHLKISGCWKQKGTHTVTDKSRLSVLSIVLLCSEQWLSRFGKLNASERSQAQMRSQHNVSRVSLLQQPELWVMVFDQINMCDYQSSHDPMIRLEEYLCSIYCVSVWFQPGEQSHTLFCQHRRRVKEVLKLIYSLLCGWAGSQLTNTPYVCPAQLWLFSSAAVKHDVYVDVSTTLTVILSMLHWTA